MPNYPTHARWGRIGAGAMAVAVGGGLFTLFPSPLLAVVGAIGAGVTTFVGAIYPDVDHHKSIPRKKAVRAFRVLVWLGVVSLAIMNWDALVAVVETAVVDPGETASAAFLDTEIDLPPAFVASAVTFLGAVFLASLVNPVLDAVTFRHRGWTHSAPINFVLTGALVGVIWLLTDGVALSRRVAAAAVVATFFVGILVHLGLDGEIV